MSLFDNWVSAAIDENSTAGFKTISPQWIIDDEQPLYDFLKRHIERYNRPPTIEALQREGLRLSPRGRNEEATDYYVDEMRKRFAYNAVNDRHQTLVAAMRDRDVDTIQTVLAEMNRDVRQAAGAYTFDRLADVAQTVVADYREAKLRSGLAGITLRWDSLNDATGGAMPTDVVVVAGRPSVGKSYVLMELALAGWLDNKRVGVVSMEMGKEQLVRRALGRMTGINPSLIRNGTLAHWEEQNLAQCVGRLAEDQLFNVVAGQMKKSVDGIDSLLNNTELDALYIDAAYLLTPSGRKNGYLSRWESATEVLNELKSMAIQRNIPIIITLQFNRSEKLDNKNAPDMANIAGTGAAEQDASIIVGITHGAGAARLTTRKLSNLKNREGQLTEFNINFNFSPMNFDEIRVSELDGVGGGAAGDFSWMV